VRKISQVAYVLKLPKESCIHIIFHVSYLKRVLGKHQTTHPTLNDEGEVVLEPEFIISTREKGLYF